MERGGRAWRGYFPVGAELTSGRPDLKEGLYFGAELPADDPRVLAGLPLHGGNLFPRQVPRLRPLVLSYLDALTSLGQAVLRGVALSLGLDAGYFAEGYTADPTILFRIFHYPPSADDGWGVGEHTDYGLLTLLAQDDSGGLQVAAPEGWTAAPPAARHVRLQHRRHARPDDRRLVPLDAAPGPQHDRSRPPLVPVLHRSGVRGRGPAAARARCRGG